MENEIYGQYIEYLSEVQNFTEQEIINEPANLTDRLARTGVFIANIGKLTADCKKALNKAKDELFIAKENLLFKSPPTIVQEFIKAKCKDELFLCDWCDRLGATLVHQSDEIRTLLSYAKTELSLFNQGYNQNIQ